MRSLRSSNTMYLSTCGAGVSFLASFTASWNSLHPDAMNTKQNSINPILTIPELFKIRFLELFQLPDVCVCRFVYHSYLFFAFVASIQCGQVATPSVAEMIYIFFNIVDRQYHPVF